MKKFTLRKMRYQNHFKLNTKPLQTTKDNIVKILNEENNAKITVGDIIDQMKTGCTFYFPSLADFLRFFIV